MKKKTITLAAAITATIAATVTGCSAADVASDNLSKAADNFEIERRVVFFNGITDEYMLEIVGRCSILDEGDQLEVTCLRGDDQAVKHFLGLSDNVTYFVEQLGFVETDIYNYRVIFRPETVAPAPELDLSVRPSQAREDAGNGTVDQ